MPLQNAEAVTAADMDGLAASAFPLCMQALHEGLKTDHHLKHSGRQQYGLFIKGVGLPLEEALTFWQSSFSKKMTPEAFLKQYAYNIRHNYGKEGKRTDYTPYSCTKIISGAAPGGGERHGCPYKHWDGGNLRAALSKMRLSAPAVDNVMEAVRSRDYQVACRRQFEFRFPGVIAANVGNHPNAYADEARAYLRTKAEGAEGSAGAGSNSSSGGAGAAGGGFSVGSQPTSPAGAAAAAMHSPAGSGAAAMVMSPPMGVSAAAGRSNFSSSGGGGVHAGGGARGPGGVSGSSSVSSLSSTTSPSVSPPPPPGSDLSDAFAAPPTSFATSAPTAAVAPPPPPPSSSPSSSAVTSTPFGDDILMGLED